MEWFKLWHRIFLMVLTINLLSPTTWAAKSMGFYAYYTKINTNDQTLDAIVGEHADIIVNIHDKGQLVFSRQSSYLPHWETKNGQWTLPEIVRRHGDGTKEAPDKYNKYSYVRIIENEADQVIIHWRYMSDFKNYLKVTNREFTENIVHESFMIEPDGTVTREIRKSSARFDEWQDPQNKTIQKLKLNSEGIMIESEINASLSKKQLMPLSGSSLKGPLSVVNDRRRLRRDALVAWWKFDEGMQARSWEKRDQTLESIGNQVCHIDGHKTLWKKGVSGTSLAFDGYYTNVVLSAEKTAVLKDRLVGGEGFTVEAWLALGAYPWNDVRIIQQLEKEGQKGFYLGVDAYGHAVFVLNGYRVRSSQKLKINRWTHVAATFHRRGKDNEEWFGGAGLMRLYVDGILSSSKVTSLEKAHLELPNTNLSMGLNPQGDSVTDTVRGYNQNYTMAYGLEGLIDEVKIYNEVISQRAMWNLYSRYKPADGYVNHPDLQERRMPDSLEKPGVFGASYTHLKYHDLWDGLWRENEWPDVVVKFDDFPTSLVYWRGINYGPSWVTDKNHWVSPQSLEIGTQHGCAEHMSDKQARYTHVRVIENTDARILIHWRYSPVDITYDILSPSNFVDEYHAIYPDGVTARFVHFYSDSEDAKEEANWSDTQFINQAETGPLDNLHRKAVHVANLAGQTQWLEWTGTNGIPDNNLENSCIGWINTKSDYKVFVVFDKNGSWGTGGSQGWAHWEQSGHTKDPFAGPWNHWPVCQMPSDGRFVVNYDRVSSIALGGCEVGTSALYGFNNTSVDDVIPLAKSWNQPPKINKIKGAASNGYSKSQRAYVMERSQLNISFTLGATDQSPVINPCFVVKKWASNRQAQLKINGKSKEADRYFRQGIIRDTDGSRTLVIWLKLESISKTDFEITQMAK